MDIRLMSQFVSKPVYKQNQTLIMTQLIMNRFHIVYTELETELASFSGFVLLHSRLAN